MSEARRRPSAPRGRGAIRTTAVAIACLLRRVPFFFRARPRTPLRVLGIVALDTLHVLRTSRPLPPRRAHELALFLDLQGCANAAWDHKALSRTDYHAIQDALDIAGLGACIDGYLRRLRDLESRRPAIGGDHRRFDEIREYREGVARLVFETAAAIALAADIPADRMPGIESDCDLEALVRILLQCQIIDDALDYRDDLSGGLPSYLTACSSLREGLELTAGAARSYGAALPAVFPLRLSLAAATAAARLAVAVAAGAAPFGLAAVITGPKFGGRARQPPSARQGQR
jgi:hypothetical protein